MVKKVSRNSSITDQGDAEELENKLEEYFGRHIDEPEYMDIKEFLD